MTDSSQDGSAAGPDRSFQSSIGRPSPALLCVTHSQLSFVLGMLTLKVQGTKTPIRDGPVCSGSNSVVPVTGNQ